MKATINGSYTKDDGTTEQYDNVVCEVLYRSGHTLLLRTLDPQQYNRYFVISPRHEKVSLTSGAEDSGPVIIQFTEAKIQSIGQMEGFDERGDLKIAVYDY